MGKLIHSNPELMTWREAVAWEARREFGKQELLAGALALRVTFHMPVPKTVKRELPHVAPDLDKLCRSIGDSLEGVIFANDGQITNIQAVKFYAIPPHEPGATIRVSEID